MRLYGLNFENSIPFGIGVVGTLEAMRKELKENIYDNIIYYMDDDYAYIDSEASWRPYEGEYFIDCGHVKDGKFVKSDYQGDYVGNEVLVYAVYRAGEVIDHIVRDEEGQLIRDIDKTSLNNAYNK